MKIKGVDQHIVDAACFLGIIQKNQLQCNEWGLVKDDQSIRQLKGIYDKPLECFKARWYQCDIIKKDGQRDLLYRFIADSYKRAKIKMFFWIRRELTGSAKNEFYYSVSRHYIKTFDIYLVPDEILAKYDFNIGNEVDKFYKAEKESNNQTSK